MITQVIIILETATRPLDWEDVIRQMPIGTQPEDVKLALHLLDSRGQVMRNWHDRYSLISEGHHNDK